VPPACVREAWLLLNGNRLDLEDASKGYFCQSLDLGSPDVREVMSPVPDARGEDDTTQFLGGRIVSASVSALRGAGARIDEVASLFAPYMDPAARPELHYVLDRGANPERMLYVRGKAYEWPVVGAEQRDISLQFVAADPVAYDPTTHTVSLGSTGGSWPTQAPISTPGDVMALPKVVVQGPTAATWSVYLYRANPRLDLYIAGKVAIPAGTNNITTFDCARRTATNALGQSVLGSLVDWSRHTWLTLPPGAQLTAYSYLNGTDVTVCHADIIWQDGYLS
jgi:hypothetical protein